jgi:hypothetical protein
MKKFYVDTTKIYEDVCGWTQTKEELEEWTPEKLREELETIDFPEDENGYTLDELSKLYYDPVQKLISKI